MQIRAFMTITAVLALAPGCVPAPQTCLDAEDYGLDSSRVLDPTLPDPSFLLGVEYIQNGLEDTYAATGVASAKTRLEAFEWGVSEPRAPRRDGVHVYDWRCTDAQIGAWQQAGIQVIQSYLSPESSWGSVGLSDIAPQPAYEESYRAWVRAIFERYDGDGVDDMPGLVRPVRHWVMGGEWTGFWPNDDADSYLDWLEMTAEEARGVFPQVHLGLIPFFVSESFDGNVPTDAEIAEDLADPPPAQRNSTAGMLAILDRPELFDSVSLHSLGDYTEIPPMLAWFREQMEERGYDRPLVFDDAFSMGILANEPWDVWHPMAPEQKEEVLDLLDAVTAGSDPAAEAWLRRLNAAGVMHKAATALGEGASGIQIGNTEDWLAGGDALRGTTVDLIGAAAHMGMVDVTRPDGAGFGQLRVPGDPRPALGALELASRWIGDGTTVVERIGGTTGVRGYAFERDGAPFWIVWSEDDLVQLPDELESSELWSLPLPAGVTRVGVTVTPSDSPDIVTNEIEVPTGTLEIDVGELPTVIEVL